MSDVIVREMRWLRYALLLWFAMISTVEGYQTFLIWNVMSNNTIRETLIDIVQALLTMIYIWSNPPRSKECDQILMEETQLHPPDIQLHPPAPEQPGQAVMDAADRLKTFARR